MCKKCGGFCDNDIDEKPDAESVGFSELLERNCELCTHSSTYNEDRQIWCHKFNKQVSDDGALKCNEFENAL
jgi:hypothetical protein